MSGRFEVLCIGDELLDGRVVDTNTPRLALALAAVGGRIAQRTTVTDDIDAIVREARAIAARGTSECVVSGGLGPTADDVTSEAFAALAGAGMSRDQATVAALEARFARRGLTMTDNQRKQADRPTGSELLPNPVGTAPGFALTWQGCRFVCVPGVPSEFDTLVEAYVVAPRRAGATPRIQRLLKSFGLTEGEVDHRLQPIAGRWPAVRVGYRAKFPEIHVTLSGVAADEPEIAAAAAFASTALGEAVFAESDVSLAAVLLDRLRSRGATLALAESCTGGLVGDLVTDVPGASDVLLLGVVAYGNRAKEELLDVPPELLREHGAVSEPVVLAMAEGARRRAGSGFAIAVSGVAGPGGGTPDKPVGTIWIAAIGAGLSTTRRLSLPFDRRRNKSIAAHAAVDLLRRALS